MRGVSHTAVVKAIASGRIVVEPDGSIIPDKADKQWDAATDPSKQRQQTRIMGSPLLADRSPTKPVPASAIKAIDDTIPPEPGEQGNAPQFMRARTANEILKASTARVRLAKMQGELVDRQKATALIFELARRERDSWLNWPSRVAANMAADLGIDAHLMQTTLERYIRDQLADLAEVKLELR